MVGKRSGRVMGGLRNSGSDNGGVRGRGRGDGWSDIIEYHMA